MDRGAQLSRKEFFAAVIATRWGRMLGALGVAGIGVLAAWVVWEARDYVALLLGGVMVLLGFQLANQYWPTTDEERATAERLERWRKRYWSFRLKGLLWVGLGGTVLPIWRLLHGGQISGSEFVVPAVFCVVGGVAEWVWRFKHQQGRSSAN